MRFIIFIITIVFIQSFVYAEDNQIFINNLVEKSRQLDLANDREWQALLHYKYNIFSGNRSLVDDETFFLSSKGKNDPKAEIEATILSIFNEEALESDNEHNYCLFPARRNYLIKKLEIDIKDIPYRSCDDYEYNLNLIKPTSVTLVFPFMYTSRPASMFGHTLLRINHPSNEPLLGYAIGYGAVMPDPPSIWDKTIKGLIGLLPAVFTVKQYNLIVHDYANVDKRDMWEYNLNLTEEETITLFNHVYEMASKQSGYWFLDENCSYKLLMLLEVVRPDLELATSMLFEMPSSTVKTIMDAGLVTDIEYRPSLASRINNIAHDMPRKSVATAIEVGEDKQPLEAITNSDYSDEIKASMYDLAVEVMQDRYYQMPQSDENSKEYTDTLISYLLERSKLGIKQDYKTIKSTAPHEGHDPSNVILGVGLDNNKFYTELGFKAAFHTLYDIDTGFIPNSEITVLDFNMRWNTAYGDIKLQDMKILGLRTYTPVTKTTADLSYRFELGGKQKEFQDGETFTTYLDGGAGYTFEFANIYVWALGIVDFSFAHSYQGTVGIGLGADVGISYAHDFWGKWLIEADYSYYVLGGGGHEYNLKGSFVVPMTQNFSMLFQYEWGSSWDIYSHDYSMALRYYF